MYVFVKDTISSMEKILAQVTKREWVSENRESGAVMNSCHRALTRQIQNRTKGRFRINSGWELNHK